jgi:CubicO group peptidase (beta-lactamase class C family)
MLTGRLREIRRDRTSTALGHRQMQAMALVAVLGLAGLGGALRTNRVSASASPSVPAVARVATPLRPLETKTPARVAEIESVDAATVGLDPSRLDDAAAAVRREVRRGAFPGGALAVGRRSGMVLLKGIGSTRWDGPAVDPNTTVYDLASLTKVVATTTAVMLMVEDGKMELDAPVQRYLPEFSGGAKALVTVRQLLTHTSGLPAWTDVGGLSPDRALETILHTPLANQPGEKVVYSDLGFVVLFHAAQRAAGEPVPQLLERRVFRPLGMTRTRYTPGEGCTQCAPTLRKKDGSVYQGSVHDPIARALGGISGNAGLFSTAADLGRFAARLAGGGQLDGVRVLKQQTVESFTRRQPGAKTRALGWDTPEPDGTGAAGSRISPRAFGHTGYTGTSLWVDPDRGTWTVLLTNRTFAPHASNRIMALRRTVHDEVAMSLRDTMLMGE